MAFLGAIALASMLCSAVIIVGMVSQPGKMSDLAVAATITYAAVPVAVMTIALGSMAVVHAIRATSREQIAAIERAAPHL
jgi:hypothetical protein